MPTYETTSRFAADLDRLTLDQRHRFHQAVMAFVADLYTDRGRFRASLRVKGVRSSPCVFEMTWDSNGRATWQYGPALHPGVQHVIWRRIGTHSALTSP